MMGSGQERIRSVKVAFYAETEIAPDGVDIISEGRVEIFYTVNGESRAAAIFTEGDETLLDAVRRRARAILDEIETEVADQLALQRAAKIQMLRSLPAGSEFALLPDQSGWIVCHPDTPAYIVRLNGSVEQIAPSDGPVNVPQ